MADEVILGQAILDHQQVLTAIDEMEKNIQEFGQSGDTSLKKLGNALGLLGKEWEKQAATALKTAEANVRAGNKQEKALKQLRKLVQAFAKDATAAAKGLRQMAESGQELGEIRFAEPAQPDVPITAAAADTLNQIDAIQGRFKTYFDTVSTLQSHLGGKTDELRARFNPLGLQILEMFQKAKTPGEGFGKDLDLIEQRLQSLIQRTNEFKPEKIKLEVEVPEDQMLVDLSQAEAELKKFSNVIESLFESGDQDAARFANRLDTKVSQALDDAAGDAKKVNQALADGTREANKFINTLPGIKEKLQEAAKAPDPLQDKLDTKQLQIELKELDKTLEAMAKSGVDEIKKEEAEFHKLRNVIKNAYDTHDKEAKETITALRKVNSQAKRTSKGFDEGFGRVAHSADRAGVSVWKVGVAIDRVGVRGVGGLIRVVDAFKGLNPAIIGAAVAAGGLLLIIGKLIGAAVELGKKAAGAFYEFTKGAVEASSSIEILDRQFAALMGGSEELGKILRENLLGLGVEFGQDLTQSFARLLVPLTNSQEQIRGVAEALSAVTFSIPGTDFERLVTIFTQMMSGQFRGAKLTLRMTGAEVGKVQAFQEEFGLLQGTLMGLQAFMDRRGIDFTNISDSMSVARAQLVAFKKQIENVLGEPVKDELGEQLSRLGEFIEDNKDEILEFANFVGDAIADVVGKIGDFIFEFIESFDEADVADLKDTVTDVKDAAVELVDSMRDLAGEDFTNLKKALNTIVGLLETAAGFASNIADFLADPQEIFIVYDYQFLDEDFESELEKQQQKTEKQQEDIGKEFEAWAQETAGSVMNVFTRALADWDLISDEVRDKWLVGIDEAMLELSNEVADMWLPPKLPDFGVIPMPSNENINQWLEYNALMIAVEDSAIPAAEALEEVNKALDDLERSRQQREMQTQVDFDRRMIKLEEDFSRRREDALAKRQENLATLGREFINKQIEIEIAGDRKSEDLTTEYNRRIEDANTESHDKQVDAEKKFRDRLQEIRARFDFDAQEAIRKNDAVSLLRIRRRMRFELEQEKRKQEDTTEQAETEAQRKRDKVDLWLQREIEDADLAEKRKIDDLISWRSERETEIRARYNSERKLINKNEERKREDLEQWRTWEDEDTQTWFDEQAEKLDERLQEQYDIIAKHKQAQLKLAQYYNRQIARALTITLPPLTYLPGGVNPFTIVSGSGGSAIRIRDISPIPLTTGGRQHGGYTAARQPVTVGERGAETHIPTQAGIISPHVPFMMNSQPTLGSGSIDNSRSIAADISLLDPSQISPIQQTIIRTVLMDEILNLGI